MFWGHNQQCSGLTPGITPCLACAIIYMVPEIKLGSVMCKTNNLLTKLSPAPWKFWVCKLGFSTNIAHHCVPLDLKGLFYHFSKPLFTTFFSEKQDSGKVHWHLKTCTEIKSNIYARWCAKFWEQFTRLKPRPTRAHGY